MMTDVLWKLFTETPYSRHEIDEDVGYALEVLPPLIVEAAQKLNLPPAMVTQYALLAAKNEIRRMIAEKASLQSPPGSVLELAGMQGLVLGFVYGLEKLAHAVTRQSSVSPFLVKETKAALGILQGILQHYASLRKKAEKAEEDKS